MRQPPSLPLTMTERERPIMDLNLPAIEQADAPAGPDIKRLIDNPQEHLQPAQTEHYVATTACETPSPTARHSVLADMTTMDVVKEYRLCTDNAGAAAEFPGEVGKPQDGQVSDCVCCSKAELSKKTLICDVCEQSFHLRCLKLRDSQAVAFDEWVCASCAMGQKKPKWPLGRIGIHNQGSVRASGIPGGQQLTPSESSIGLDGSQLGKINKPKQERDMDQSNSLQDIDQKAIAVANSELEEPRTRNTRQVTAEVEQEVKICDSIKDAGFEAQDILHRLNEESIRTCRLRIKDMTCTSCSTSIESSLSLLPGVKRAVVALATEEAQLDYNPNLVSYKQLMKAIEDTGFEAVLISVGEENDKLTLKVEGAHSIEGINLIKTSLEALPGVKSVEMELHVETVMVSYDPDQTGPRCFIEVIESTGFPLYNFKASVCNPPGIGGSDRSGEIAHYKVSFLWSCIFTIPVFLLSMVLMYVPGIKECLDTKIVNMLTIGQVLRWLLSTVVQVVFGRQFYVDSYKALCQAAANMDVLVALGTNAAYFYSVYIVLRSATSTNFVGADFFETNAMLIFFILLGKYLEVLAKGKTSEAIAKLMELAPDIAVLLVTDVDGNIILKSLSHSKEDLQAKGSSDYWQSGPISSHQTSESLLSRDLDDGMEASSKDGDSGGLSQQHLQRLKEFVAQRGGQIEDDWTVSVKKRTHSGKAFDVTFYSPDGVKFRSRLEVARYLGLSEQKKGETGVRGLSAPAVKTRRKKESSKIQKHEDYSEEVEQSDDEVPESAKRRKIEPDGVSAVQEPFPEINGPEPELQVPLQCMELKVESLGTVELRPGYCDENSVWPVGYRCSWHDFVTGSVCISEVLDGGPHTPIFRVTRKLCSDVYDESSVQSKNNRGMSKPDCEKQPLVSTSRIELKSQAIKHDFNEKVKQNRDSHQIYDEDSELEMLVGTLESFRSSYDSQKEDKWGLSRDTEDKFFTSTNPELNLQWVYGDSDTRNMNLMYAKDGNSLAKTSEQEEEKWCGVLEGRGMAIKDDIGEIVVESCSSSAAWRLLGEEFVKRFRQSRRGTRFQFGCKHLEGSLSSGFNFPFLFEGTSDNSTQAAQDAFETVCSRLMEWMAQDRFGFDIPVVQKYLSSKKSRLQTMRSPPPTGWPIGRKVSAEFVGDLLQIWEFLCRFSEVLGQKEPPSLEELEEGIAGISEDDMKRGGCKKDQMGSTRKNGVQVGYIHQGMGPQKEMHGQDFLKGQEAQNGDVGQNLASNRLTKSKRLCENSSLTPSGFCGESLAASNISLLKVALSDLQQKATAGAPDLTLETKRGKKKDADSGSAPKQQPATALPLNELTWPEVVRRYIIGLLTFTCGENTEMNVQERRKVLRCIQGDGGVLCGALDGVAAIEADAQLLAEAEKHLSYWLRGAGDQVSGTEPSQRDTASNRVLDELPAGNISRKPAWATVLEPVRKLATNVGARIRNCIRDALELNPPDWAREILEHSISKEVYKGNASGPTKRAVLSVLEQVPDEVVVPVKPERKIVYVAPIPELVMRRCRIVLRELITTDDVRVFCNSLGGTVLGYYENEDENLPLPLVTRPLDFRMIDSRLAAGAYGSSHESFAADMRQLFRNIPLVFNNREDLVKVGEVMSQHFETMYEEKVLKLANGKEEANQAVDTSVQMTIAEPNGAPSNAGGLDEELKKAPWEEGVCKICGIDKDDDSTLLCDGCDAEYHIYCLEPPLSKIPDGNWYCPSCVALEQRSPSLSFSAAALNKMPSIKFYGSKHSEAGTTLPALVASMNGKDYWQMNESERVQLLKFLCDKVLESTLIRDHVDQSVEVSFELQQKLRLLILERQNWLEKESHTLDDSSGMDITNGSGLSKRRGRKSLKPTVAGAEDTRMQIEQIRTLEVDDCQDMYNYMKPQIGSGNNRSLFSREESGFTSSSFMQQRHDGNGQHTLAEVEGSIAKVPQWGSPGLPVKDLAEEFNSTKNHSLFESDVLRNAMAISDQSNGLAVGTQETGVQLTANFKEPESRLSLHQYPLNYADGSSSFNSPDKGQLPLAGLSLQQIGDQWATPSTANQTTAIQTSFELLETEIEKLEAEIMKTAPRRECLGRDALGRTYWALGWEGKVPWLVVEAASGSMASLYDKNNGFTLPNYFTSSVETQGRCERAVDSTTMNPCASQSNEWIAYNSDDCLEQLLNWLEPTIGTEKSLKSSLTKWSTFWNRKFKWETDIKQSSLVKPSSIYSSIATNTKAIAILTKMFGAMCWSDGPNDMLPPKRAKMKKNAGEGRLFRCDCLELVWATRSHCPRCHQTYDSGSDIQAHNYSGCSYGFTAEEQSNMLLASTKFKKANLKQQVLSPPDISVIKKRFSLPSSNRERILQIGWIASKGPEFAPGLSVSPLFDPSLHMRNVAVPLGEGGLSDVTSRPSKNDLSNSSCAKVAVSTMSGAGLAVGETIRSEIAGSHVVPKLSGLSCASLSSQGLVLDHSKSEAMTAPSNSMTKHDSNRTTSQLAWTHLSNTRVTLIVKRIKSTLLDIEAALASDLLETSRGQPDRRRAWRSFVKSAGSVLELFQASMLLEQMVKAECLRETWSNWTSLSVGAGINTLAALALRIYAFDAAIKYKRSSLESDTEDSDRPGKVMKKKRKKNPTENIV